MNTNDYQGFERPFYNPEWENRVAEMKLADAELCRRLKNSGWQRQSGFLKEEPDGIVNKLKHPGWIAGFQHLEKEKETVQQHFHSNKWRNDFEQMKSNDTQTCTELINVGWKQQYDNVADSIGIPNQLKGQNWREDIADIIGRDDQKQSGLKTTLPAIDFDQMKRHDALMRQRFDPERQNKAGDDEGRSYPG